MWFVYIIRTAKNTLYTGISTDVERRFAEHCATFERMPNAKGAKFFRANQPLEIVYQQSFENRAEASREEARIKKLSRLAKLDLLNNKD